MRASVAMKAATSVVGLIRRTVCVPRVLTSDGPRESRNGTGDLGQCRRGLPLRQRKLEQFVNGPDGAFRRAAGAVEQLSGDRPAALAVGGGIVQCRSNRIADPVGIARYIGRAPQQLDLLRVHGGVRYQLRAVDDDDRAIEQ